jgi:4-amino-4-deoxy-L-arabinose transferase-like glycosyltransferase
VVASRAFQPDPWMVMWILLSAYAGLRWLESDGRSWLWAALAGACCGLAILIKAVAAFAIGGLLLGAFITLLPGWKVFRRPQTYLLGGLALAIPAVYYFGLGQRSSDFASFWIVSFSGLLVTRKFYIQWLGLIHGIMDLTLFFGAVLGAFLTPRRGKGLVVGLFLGYFLTGLAFPFQIYTHDYYSLMLVPLAALGLAPLAEALFERLSLQPRIWKVAFVVVFLGISSYYAWIGRSLIFASYNPGEQEAWVRMGQELPRDGNIIALTHDYGNRLKYYSAIIPNRLWPVQGDLDLDTARGQVKYDDFNVFFKDQTQGMRYFLVNLFSELDSQPDLKNMLYNHYPIVKQGNGYILFDLTRGK